MGWLTSYKKCLKGKRIGNKIADNIGVSRNLFHTAVVKGGLEGHYLVLASLQDQGCSLIDACDSVINYLSTGLMVLESEYGSQPKINQARETVKLLLSDEGTDTKENETENSSEEPDSKLTFKGSRWLIDNDSRRLYKDMTINTEGGTYQLQFIYEIRQPEAINRVVSRVFNENPELKKSFSTHHLSFMIKPSLGYADCFLLACIQGLSTGCQHAGVVSVSETNDDSNLFVFEEREDILKIAERFDGKENLILEVRGRDDVLLSLPVINDDNLLETIGALS